MTRRKKIVHYVNQFFGQMGGEEYTDMPPLLKDEPIPLSKALGAQLGSDIEVCCTVIAGDNFMAENPAEGRRLLVKLIEGLGCDLFVAGPAFFAGRYGMACGELCKGVTEDLGIPSITAMYEENPGVDAYRSSVLIAPCGKSAGTMKEALQTLASLAKEVLSGRETYETPHFKQGRRLNVFAEKNGAERALDMLMKKVRKEPFTTEVPLPVFGKVAPAPGVKDIAGAKIALISTGGVVPYGNPDRMPTGNSQKWALSDISRLTGFEKGDWETVHAGYDVAFVDDDPDRLVPLDVAVDLVREGKLGVLHDKYLYTIGNTTAVANAKRFGEEMAAYLVEHGVDAAIMTST